MITNTSPSPDQLLVDQGVVSGDRAQVLVGLQTGIPPFSLAEAAATLRKVTDAFPLKPSRGRETGHIPQPDW